MIPVFNAYVKRGKVIFDHQEQWDGYLFTLESKYVHVTIKKRQKKRSNPQNNWYWACVVAIPAEHFGYLPEEMHDAYKLMFLKEGNPDKPVTLKSTTRLSTVEFNEYVEKCRQWCAEQGIYIPNPDEIFLDKT